MLMIVRLYPKTDLSRVWNYVENEIKDDPSKPITPLYATPVSYTHLRAHET